ncbi:hypothetical protein [Clostridium sp. UBA7503]|uniref:hypothetical protein n=1 Tax=Clostridium sp. UBA7503 TaxID=1946377 RepID=UPI003217C454
MRALGDRKILFGIGIGIILGIFFTIPAKIDYKLSDGEIEIRAKKLGMTYPDQIKIDIKAGANND